jgi:hypothetical protein
LCSDVVDQFGVDLVRLESIMPLAYDLDWLRPRVLVDVPPIARELLALCFCDSCVRRASAAGLDVARLQQLVTGAVVHQLSDDAHVDDGTLAADPELNEFLAQHETASIELARAVTSRLAASSTKVGSTIRTPFRSLRPDVDDHLTEELAETVDQLAVSTTASERNRRIAAVAVRAPHHVGLSMLIPRGLKFRSMRNADSNDDPLPEQLRAAVALGVDEVELYNYGLLRDEDVRMFMAAYRDALARPT